MSLPLEEILEGKYKILEKIGEGGIGSIYKVRHRLLDETRVIKVLREQVAGQEELQKRFVQEARAASRLRHPNIARLYDFAIAEDGTAYIVMEFIDGVGLDDLLSASGPPSLALALEIARQSLAALSCLHDNGFVHRDISPDNLMLARDYEGRPLIKLIDLGIAKDLGQKDGLTVAGSFLGKIRYCAPEQLSGAGAKELDQRSDNYSFGVLLYELLTGEYPYHGESFPQLAAGHLRHPPRDFAETDPEGRVPPALREVILTALKKDPAERMATAEDFSQMLEPIQATRSGLCEETERTVAVTTGFELAAEREHKKSGSTQDRLDRQFGMERTPPPDSLEALATARTVAVQSPGGSEPAASPAEKPAEGKPSPPPPAEVEPSIPATAEPPSPPEEKPPTEPMPEAETDSPPESAAVGTPAEPREPVWIGWLNTLRRVPVIAGLGAGLLVLIVAGWILLTRASDESPAAEPAPVAGEVAAQAMLVAATEGWAPERTKTTELAFVLDEVAGLAVPPTPQEVREREEAARAAAKAEAVPSPPPSSPEPAAEAEATPADAELAELEGDPVVAEPEPPAEEPAPLEEEPEVRVGDLVGPGPGVVPPEMVRSPSVKYPRAASRLRREATVKVRVLVDENGSPIEVQNVGPKVGMGFDQAAVKAAENALWEPATKNGVRVKMWLELVIDFRP